MCNKAKHSKQSNPTTVTVRLRKIIKLVSSQPLQSNWKLNLPKTQKRYFWQFSLLLASSRWLPAVNHFFYLSPNKPHLQAPWTPPCQPSPAGGGWGLNGTAKKRKHKKKSFLLKGEGPRLVKHVWFEFRHGIRTNQTSQKANRKQQFSINSNLRRLGRCAFRITTRKTMISGKCHVLK